MVAFKAWFDVTFLKRRTGATMKFAGRVGRPSAGAEPDPAELKQVRRQQLIEATITAISRRGLSRTTLAEVAKIAGLSAGIVNFYFKSKDALLLATLRYLADEYEAACGEAVRPGGASPAAVLEAVIDTDFDPSISDPKKVAVWFAFWSEARARPAYLKPCRHLKRPITSGHARCASA